MRISKNELIQNIPIIFFFCYLTVTVILFALGPWQWPISSPLKLYGFLAIAHVSLVIGYVSLKGNNVPTYVKRRKPKWSPDTIVAASSLLNIVFFVLLFLSAGEDRIAITEAALDPARAYAQLAVSELARTGTNVLTYIRFIFAPVLLLSIPLGIMFWEKLGKKTRIAVFLTITANLLIWTTTGKNKGFADFILIIPWFLFARVVSGKWKPKRTKTILICALFIGLSILFLLYFSINYEGRMGTYGGSSSSLGGFMRTIIIYSLGIFRIDLSMGWPAYQLTLRMDIMALASRLTVHSFIHMALAIQSSCIILYFPEYLI